MTLRCEGSAAQHSGWLGYDLYSTVSAKMFLASIHELIDQNRLSRIPIVWINPVADDGHGIKDRIQGRGGVVDGESEALHWSGTSMKALEPQKCPRSVQA